MKNLLLLALIAFPSLTMAAPDWNDESRVSCIQMRYTFSCEAYGYDAVTARQHEYNLSQDFLQKLINQAASNAHNTSPADYNADMDSYKRMNEDMFRKYFGYITQQPGSDADSFQLDVYSEAQGKYQETSALLQPAKPIDDVETKYYAIVDAYTDYRADKIDFMSLMYTIKDNSK